MPVMGGVEAVDRLRQGGAHVLVLSASGEHRDVLDAVRVGASGYLVKSATAAELVDAVLRTSRGGAVFSPGLAGLVLGELRRPTGPPLTPRETEILRLVATGRSYRQIADELVISHRTVQNHVQNVLGKLQLRNRVQLARYALDSGLEIPDDMMARQVEYAYSCPGLGCRAAWTHDELSSSQAHQHHGLLRAGRHLLRRRRDRHGHRDHLPSGRRVGPGLPRTRSRSTW